MTSFLYSKGIWVSYLFGNLYSLIAPFLLLELVVGMQGRITLEFIYCYDMLGIGIGVWVKVFYLID